VCTWPRIQVTLSKSVTRIKATDFDVELIVANEATVVVGKMMRITIMRRKRSMKDLSKEPKIDMI
jgi:hypothetical protein